MNEDARYKRAKMQVGLIRLFYIHLSIYIIVNFGLFVINMLSGSDKLWFYWPIIGWGIGLLFHGLLVFGLCGVFGKDWEEKKIKELMK